MKRKLFIYLLAGCVGLLLFTCMNDSTSPDNAEGASSSSLPAATLRSLAESQSLSIGTVFNLTYSLSSYPDHSEYRHVLTNQFDSISLEWEFAPSEIWTNDGVYDYSYLDQALGFAYSKGLKVRGSHLLWYATVPEWLTNSGYSAAQVETRVRAYISNLFQHIQASWPDVMTEVNVVNESIRMDSHPAAFGNLRPCFWVETLGTNYVLKAFQWVKEVFPSAKLYLNDYGNEMDSTMQDRFLALADSLVSAGAPIDGVGLQCHFTIDTASIYDEPFSALSFRTVLQEYAALGLDIAVTELDVRINDDQSGISADKLTAQSNIYRLTAEECSAQPAVKSITTWGFNDDLSYLNGQADWLPQIRDWGLLYDGLYQPKPSYYGLLSALRK